MHNNVCGLFFKIRSVILPHLRLNHPAFLFTVNGMRPDLPLVAGIGTANTAKALPPRRRTGTNWE